MVSYRRSFFACLPIIMLTLFFSGCAGTVKNMRSVPPESIVSSPQEGKSMIVFMRPSGIAYAIQSSVFEINDQNPSLAGILAAKKKMAYQLEPGEHLFMVIGESADFMSAKVEANKTYYTLVTPRMGVWKARFSLRPVHQGELNSSELTEWLNSCEWVEKINASDDWANRNMASIQSKYKNYFNKWISKDPSERPNLLPHDGK